MVLGVLTLMGSSDASELRDELDTILNAHRGKVAVAIKHLETGESYYHNGDTPMPTASLIKFPVMAAAYRQVDAGELKLDQTVALKDEDKVPGSGVLTSHFSAGVTLSLRDAVRLMIAFSDNTATNLVLDQIGLEATTGLMAQLEMPQTRIHAKVFRRDSSIDPERSKKFGLGSTTARETLRLYELLHGESLAEPSSCREMLEHLLACQDDTKLKQLLSKGTRVAHKGGAVSRSRCDAGIIFSSSGAIAVCVFTSENEDRRFEPDNEAHQLCGRVAKIAFDHFNPPTYSPGEPLASELAEGSSGTLVEIIQRTLNDRLEPSPDLSVDGDFGPMTRAAVLRFQQDQGLPLEGRVSATTWAALSPLVTRDKPVPAPEVINAQRLPRQPRDPLDGPPWVTCKAWAIADRQTGKVLWSQNVDQPLDFASTTKIMTAFIVLRLAEQNPAVLEETLVFSSRADNTRGSTAGIMAGERLSVGKSLYGLLLPSGNDASIALAEHFGGRFAVPDASSGQEVGDPLVRFVAQMNRTAVELNMTHTTYHNTHGLTARGHHASARDLIRLAHAAWKMERFRSYVATRQFGCAVTGPGGYVRHVLWKNTNRLLPIEGYEGVKTGTTTAAGACLVSAARRDDEALLMVVLGSASSESRYVDSRNLYRWAWQQLRK
jgi:D-alanyl-D-alanine carboxypeptidase (penicillin-binding protein 5/6)